MSTKERVDEMLDEALEMTFPASDPIAVYMREPASDENRADAQEIDAARSGRADLVAISPWGGFPVTAFPRAPRLLRELAPVSRGQRANGNCGKGAPPLPT